MKIISAEPNPNICERHSLKTFPMLHKTTACVNKDAHRCSKN